LLPPHRYRECTSAALVINQLVGVPVTIWQTNHPDEKRLVMPGEMMHFAWSEACEGPTLCLQCGEDIPHTKSLSVGVTMLGATRGVADLYNGGQRYLMTNKIFHAYEYVYIILLFNTRWTGQKF